MFSSSRRLKYYLIRQRYKISGSYQNVCCLNSKERNYTISSPA
nr:MAG TPA: hypothetical protein [Bacteriophage sp.]